MVQKMSKRTKFSHSDVMIDIETLSTEKNAAIVSIAAKKFNPFSPENDGETLAIFVDIEDCKALGLHQSDSTIEWWKKNDAEIYKYNFESTPRLPLKEAVEQLNNFIRGSTRYWCQGMNFDCPILENAFRVVEITPAWKYWQWRDARTISKLHPAVGPRNDHNPAKDCENQIAVVKRVFNELKITQC